MGETLVVDNRGSVGGILGAELGAKSPPDRYTLLLAANSLLTINPRVYKKLPYDPQRDLQPITQLTEGGNVVVVHPSVPAKSIKEFIALAKAKPGDLNYATTGAGNLLGITNFKDLPDVKERLLGHRTREAKPTKHPAAAGCFKGLQRGVSLAAANCFAAHRSSTSAVSPGRTS